MLFSNCLFQHIGRANPSWSKIVGCKLKILRSDEVLSVPIIDVTIIIIKSMVLPNTHREPGIGYHSTVTYLEMPREDSSRCWSKFIQELTELTHLDIEHLWYYQTWSDDCHTMQFGSHASIHNKLLSHICLEISHENTGLHRYNWWYHIIKSCAIGYSRPF